MTKHCVDAEGNTDLHDAAYYSDSVESFLNPDDLKAKNKNGETPLHRAASQGNMLGVMQLIDAGADINAQDNRSMTPLIAAVYKNRHSVVKLLIHKGADLNLSDYNNSTALHIAARNLDEKMMKILIAAGANQSLKNAFGDTARDSAEWYINYIFTVY